MATSTAEARNHGRFSLLIPLMSSQEPGLSRISENNSVAAVLVGALTAVLGSILVSLDTDVLMKLLDLPPSLTNFLRYRLAGG